MKLAILFLMLSIPGLLLTPESGLNDVFGVIVAVAAVRLLDKLLPVKERNMKEKRKRRTKAEMESAKCEREKLNGQAFIPGTATLLLLLGAGLVAGCTGMMDFKHCQNGKCIHIIATNDIPLTAPVP